MHFPIKPPLLLLTSVAFLFSGSSWWDNSPVSEAMEKNEVKEERFFSPDEVDYSARPLNLHEVRSAIEVPVEVKNAGISGEEVFRVYIDKKGKYLRHESVNSHHPILRLVCESALPQLRCLSAEKDGDAVPSWVEVAFLFE